MQSLREKIDIAMKWAGLALFIVLMVWFIETAKVFGVTEDIATGLRAIILLLMTMSMMPTTVVDRGITQSHFFFLPGP